MLAGDHSSGMGAKRLKQPTCEKINLMTAKVLQEER